MVNEEWAFEFLFFFFSVTCNFSQETFNKSGKWVFLANQHRKEANSPGHCVSFGWDSDSHSHGKQGQEGPISPSEVPDVQQWDSFPHSHPERYREQRGPCSLCILLAMGVNIEFGSNPAVPERGQHEPQLWASAAAETVKIAVKGIRLVQKRMKDRGIQLCMPRGLL